MNAGPFGIPFKVGIAVFGVDASYLVLLSRAEIAVASVFRAYTQFLRAAHCADHAEPDHWLHSPAAC